MTTWEVLVAWVGRYQTPILLGCGVVLLWVGGWWWRPRRAAPSNAASEWAEVPVPVPAPPRYAGGNGEVEAIESAVATVREEWDAQTRWVVGEAQRWADGATALEATLRRLNELAIDVAELQAQGVRRLRLIRGYAVWTADALPTVKATTQDLNKGGSP